MPQPRREGWRRQLLGQGRPYDKDRTTGPGCRGAALRTARRPRLSELPLPFPQPRLAPLHCKLRGPRPAIPSASPLQCQLGAARPAEGLRDVLGGGKARGTPMRGGHTTGRAATLGRAPTATPAEATAEPLQYPHFPPTPSARRRVLLKPTAPASNPRALFRAPCRSNQSKARHARAAFLLLAQSGGAALVPGRRGT